MPAWDLFLAVASFCADGPCVGCDVEAYVVVEDEEGPGAEDEEEDACVC